MAKTYKSNRFNEAFEKRILDRLKRFEPGSRQIKEALLRIGIMLQTQIKLNIRSRGLIDTGRLINSIKYKIYANSSTSKVEVGSYGVPYAAIHEFGGDITPRNARFLTIPLSDEFRGRSARDFDDLFVKKIGGKLFLVRNRKGGGLQFAYVLRSSVHIPPRPYMRPALKQKQDDIVKIISGLFR